MDIFQILILAVIQGITELLPVSSSAHVIVAEKLMGLDPTSPKMTFLLIMLHTGTMFAVILFFWKSWQQRFFATAQIFEQSVRSIAAATLATGIVGIFLKSFIEKFILKDISHAEIELLFGNLLLVSIALATAGFLIILAGLKMQRLQDKKMAMKESLMIGAVQGICLPFRGFSRSGATISTGLLLGIDKRKVEDFSFALAVVLTPPIIIREVLRLLKAQNVSEGIHLTQLFLPGLVGMALSFIAGTLALRWLSNWLERGRWHFFGFYCLFVSAIVFWLHYQGF